MILETNCVSDFEYCKLLTEYGMFNKTIFLKKMEEI